VAREAKGDLLRVGDEPDLRARRRVGDETGQRLQEIGVEARLRLVEGNEGGQPIGQQQADQREVAERAVGQLGGLEDAVRILRPASCGAFSPSSRSRMR
jgi:hypothetical protein